MKTMFKLFILILVLIIVTPILVLGYLGFVPGLSTVMGSDKPRDLGIRYTTADLTSIRTKSGVVYDKLPETADPVKSRQFSGQKTVSAEFSSAEITATMNNQPWRYWPYQNVQVKFNADGSGEVSGILIKDKIRGYATAIGVPAQAVELAVKFLPVNPPFYIKMRATLADNKVAVFEPEKFEIGRLSLPVDKLIAINKLRLAGEVRAQDVGSLLSEVSKVSNKKQLIISFINSRLTQFGGFYAKKASMTENKVIFDGSLSEKILYTP